MDLQDISFQLFGSHDSVDVDVVFFVAQLGSIQENLELGKKLGAALKFAGQLEPKINPNLAVVQEGRLVAVYKGTVDELNNSLYHTYDLHPQQFPRQIQFLLPRDKELKLLRTLRKSLSFFTRTDYRKEIKTALRAGFSAQLEFMKSVDLTGIPPKADTEVDCWKVITFSVAQVLALETGHELYTKQEVIRAFPGLEGIMQRRTPVDLKAVSQVLDQLILLADEKAKAGMPHEFEYAYRLAP